ncbi:hypothetical protein GCM10023347_00310 [Streptomyces chumphonensis]
MTMSVCADLFRATAYPTGFRAASLLPHDALRIGRRDEGGVTGRIHPIGPSRVLRGHGMGGGRASGCLAGGLLGADVRDALGRRAPWMQARSKSELRGPTHRTPASVGVVA